MRRESAVLYLFLAALCIGIQSQANEIVDLDPSQPAQALVASPEDYPGICRIQVEIPQVTPGLTNRLNCTGVLTSDHTILTAAHCFRRGYNPIMNVVSAFCGNEIIRIDEVALPEDSEWVDSTTPLESADQATLSFHGSIPDVYYPAAREKGVFFGTNGELNSGVSCFVAGFGTNNERQSGKVSTWNLSEMRVTAPQKMILVSSPDHALLHTSVDHGDSGGPMICTPPGGAPTVVGIAGGFSIDGMNSRNRTHDFFAPVFK